MNFPHPHPLVPVAALLVHFVYKRYEPASPFLAATLLLLLPSLLSLLLLAPFFSTFLFFHSTLFTSILLYRLGPFHPLARYPGPRLCKLSKITIACMSYTGKRHEYIQRLHNTYGDIVRIGPNEVSIRDVDAVTPLMGTLGLPKGPMWTGRIFSAKILPLIGTPDRAEHSQRRKPWNRAFSTVSLKGYEPLVAIRVNQLADVLKKQTEVTDLGKWMNYFAFDFMGDMAFGGGTELMREGDKDGQWDLLEHSLPAALILENLPWLAPLVSLFPGLVARLMKFRTVCAQRATRRLQAGSVTKDLFYYLNNDDGVQPTNPALPFVVSDASLAIVAGSDTTSGILSIAWYFLLRNPDVYQKLRDEVDKYYPPGEDACDTKFYSKMVYLEAVLNETLRMYPAVLSGSQRAVEPGSGGNLVGKYFLPEGTSARIHFYSMHHDPRYFAPYTDSFWPDRWIIAEGQQQQLQQHTTTTTTNNNNNDNDKLPTITHTPSAFTPFSFGPSNCVGKNLALLEMKMVLCHLVQQLTFEFAGRLVGDEEKWERELMDMFVLVKGKLDVKVRKRGEGKMNVEEKAGMVGEKIGVSNA